MNFYGRMKIGRLDFVLIWMFLALMVLPTAVIAGHVEATRCNQRPACLEAIDEVADSLIRSHMHNATEPCENFWDYACGDWTAAPFYDHVDTFGAIGNTYAQQLLAELTENRGENFVEDLERDEREVVDKLRSYFEACNNTGSYFLRMEEYLRAWPSMPDVQWPDFREPLVSAQWAPNFHWLNAIAELRRFGLDGVLISESVGFAANDSRRYIVELKMPDEDENFVNKYEFVKYFEEFGWLDEESVKTDEQEEIVRFAAEIFELETQLRELRAKHRRGRGEEERLLTLDELQQQVSNIDWQTYFAIILGEQTPPTSLAIELADGAYLQEMAALVEQTDNRIVGAYIVMRLCKFLLAVSPRITAKSCVDHMQVHLALAMDFLYDRRVYGSRAEDERAIGAMVERLRDQFAAQVQRNRLQLHEEQVAYLRSKISSMAWRLGNLPRAESTASSSWSFVSTYYSDANFTADDFFHNHWAALRHRTRKQHERLGQRVDAADYFVNDDIRQVRNAPYFVHQRNLLIVPHVFAQMPFFHHRLHPLFQHSLTGWILAHELHHGFEIDGVALDAEGNESRVGRAIRRQPRYEAGVRCLRRMPSASLIERMADINGFQLAYDAYFGAGRGGDNRLPFAGEFDEKQLYFLNFAQFFCGQLPQAIDHDRDDVRVIQILANSPEFADAFHCGAEADENPALKCQMWR